MKTIKQFSLLILALAFQPLAFAATIDFSDDAFGSTVSNNYSGMGVTFSLSAIDSSSYRGPVIDSFGDPQTSGLFNTFNYNRSIIAEFSTEVHAISFSSITDSPLTMTALDATGGTLGKVSIDGGSQIGQFTSEATIASLVFLNDSGTGHMGRGDLTTIRTLSFYQTSEVPLPASLWLFLSSLAGLGWKKSRSKH